VPNRARRKWRRWLGILGVVVLMLAVSRWRARHPREVTLIRPTVTTITETITSSGRVSGTTETLVGSQAVGVVDKLFVRAGDRVTAGQQLAILKNDVAEAQVAQAQQAVRTVQAQLEQVARAPLASEVEAAIEQVRQARAQLEQQRAVMIQAEQSVSQTRAQLNQLEAERTLATRQYGRSVRLTERGLSARSEFEETQSRLHVAGAKVRAQQQALAMAQTNVQAAQAGLTAAQANVSAQAAHLRTVQIGARPEDIQVARRRVEEAEQAWQVARQQAANAIVTAPFAGVVTAINAEIGQTVGTQGVLRLVSNETEIRVDVDESNLADLAVGQDAIISSSTFRDSTFRGTVSELAAAVDATRGTVTVTIVPIAPPAWLRPGQTVNVNIITNPAAPRLLVPATAISRMGEHSGVLVVERGRTRQKTVVTRPPTAKGVPVLAGLSQHDCLIANTRGIAPGDAVRAEGQACGGQL
jgi:HlyD family secretion protein